LTEAQDVVAKHLYTQIIFSDCW